MLSHKCFTISKMSAAVESPKMAAEPAGPVKPFKAAISKMSAAVESPKMAAEPAGPVKPFMAAISKMTAAMESPKMAAEPAGPVKPFKAAIFWPNVLGFLVLHLVALYALYLFFTFQFSPRLTAWSVFLGYVSMVGTGIAAHRLYTHRAFTANTGLRAFLVMIQTLTGQNCLYIWVRDHRQHHKFCDTDADPHNVKRGFFFSHVGWLMVRKHPDVITKGKTIDMSDLEADQFVMFQKNYYKSLYFLISVFIPVAVPYWGWNETLVDSFLAAFLLRYVLTLNATWLVNSAAHIWGMRPFNKNIQPVENQWVSIVSGGEGWHNYHHQFPWDYRAAELGTRFNLSLHLIDFFAAMGWATNLRTASSEMIRNTIAKHGDGSYTEKTMESEVFYKKMEGIPLRRGMMRTG